MSENKKILVHMCCAPCAAPSVEKLMLDEYEVVLYFCNSNIYPHEEYLMRFDSAKKLAKIINVEIKEDDYNHDLWLEKIRGFESEPEKGKRCDICFDFSLACTAALADELDIPFFTTTLTLSPHKVSKRIFELGNKYSKYLPFNFKKKNGFLRSLQLSEEYNLYRQKYCGCEFSLADMKKREKSKKEKKVKK